MQGCGESRARASEAPGGVMAMGDHGTRGGVGVVTEEDTGGGLGEDVTMGGAEEEVGGEEEEKRGQGEVGTCGIRRGDGSDQLSGAKDLVTVISHPSRTIRLISVAVLRASEIPECSRPWKVRPRSCRAPANPFGFRW
ncbi:hypothetical protein E2C01_010236 [Portunus trituberculatus]|uniref:Uncharacterized protein n=1 Tax=Portunus trituberculatus TaxID=210409 RepID=A0A5B7D7Y3_PORTR|nr:hypothetical protein [Portunus trituberculatus]